MDKDAKVTITTKSGRTYKQRAWDMGHKPGFEFWRDLKSFIKGLIGKKELRERNNDPTRYRPESRNTNRGHSLEKKE